jgi:hypothetical protein
MSDTYEHLHRDMWIFAHTHIDNHFRHKDMYLSTIHIFSFNKEKIQKRNEIFTIYF